MVFFTFFENCFVFISPSLYTMCKGIETYQISFPPIGSLVTILPHFILAENLTKPSLQDWPQSYIIATLGPILLSQPS